MCMFVCINEEKESVKYVLSNNMNKVVSYLNDKSFNVTEMPSYLTLTLKNYIVI